MPFGVIQLLSNEGVDNPSSDLGDHTSKFMFDDRCDLILGNAGIGDPGLDGRSYNSSG